MADIDDLPDVVVPPAGEGVNSGSSDQQQGQSAAAPDVPPPPPPPPPHWSTERYRNPEVPSYVPPEAFLVAEGEFLCGLELRAQIADFSRFLTENLSDDYIRCLGVKVEPRYDSSGHRINTPNDILIERRDVVMRRVLDLWNRHRARIGEASTEKRLEFKRYITREQMEMKAYGAIFGARGDEHKRLQRETGCQVILAGRGITDRSRRVQVDQKTYEDLIREDPHVRIVAPNEAALQKCLERIDWILSDEPSAIAFREEKRKELAEHEGRYNPRTWIPLTAHMAGDKRARADGDVGSGPDAPGGHAAVTSANDPDVEALLKLME